MIDERRIRIVYLNEESILDVVRWSYAPAGTCLLLTHQNEKLPFGTEVVRVFHDPARMVWGVIIEHESFAAIPHGATPPCHGGPEHVTATLVKKRIESDVIRSRPAMKFTMEASSGGHLLLLRHGKPGNRQPSEAEVEFWHEIVRLRDGYAK